jgi:tetratricopeptide (TPR) repeat protein
VRGDSLADLRVEGDMASGGLPRWWLLALIAIAAAVRLAYFLDFRASPYYLWPLLDARAYHEQALGFIAGTWPGSAPFFQDPGYSVGLAAVYQIFGPSPVFVIVMQMLLGTLLPVLVVWLAWRVLPASPRRAPAAALAGLAYALCAPPLFYEVLLVKTSVVVFVSCLHLALLMEMSRRVASNALMHTWVFVVGTLLGALIVLRGNYLVLAPLFFVWLAWALHRGTWRTTLTRALMYPLGAIAVVAPFTIHNYNVSDEFIISSSHSGASFYLGNNPSNHSGSYGRPRWLRADPSVEQSDFERQAEAVTGHTFSAHELSRYWFEQSMDWWREQPSDAIALTVKKSKRWLDGNEGGDNYDFDFVKRYFAPSLNVAPITGYFALPFGWAAIALISLGLARYAGFTDPVLPASSFGNKPLMLLVGFVIAYSLSIIAFFVFGRYRIPIYAPLLVLGVPLLYTTLCNLFQGVRWQAIPALLAVALVAIPVVRPMFSDDAVALRAQGDSVALYNIGVMALEARKPSEAFRFFNAALATGSTAPVVVLNIARELESVGQWDTAAQLYRHALAVDGGDGDTWQALARVLAKAGDTANAARALARADSLERR